MVLAGRRGRLGGRGGSRGGRAFPSIAQLPPTAQDILPPRDPNITSLFVTGVEDDLPEHALRTFFTPFGTLRSVICSHRSHCAFINYTSRAGAEAAAEACQGKAVIQGCPLRVRWGKPKALDSMDTDIRMMPARDGRNMGTSMRNSSGKQAIQGPAEVRDESDLDVIAPPPGQSDVQYPSLSGN